MKHTILNTVKSFLTINFKELQKFLYSVSFSRAFRVGVAVTLPVVIGMQLGYFEIGLALSFGAFWSSPSDISGSFKYKKFSLFFSAVLVMLVSFIGGYLHYKTWITLPVLGVVSFGIAFLSVYGFRASLISFSGLLALVVSLAHDSEELKVFQYALLVGAGGLWYLLLSKVWYRINPNAETEEFLTETYTLMAEFLETRGTLLNPQQDQKHLQSKSFNLQSQLTENHEALREILIPSRKTSAWSNYQNKRMMIFMQLVEMLETAIANPVNHERMDALFNAHPQYIKKFQDLIFEMSYQLRIISETRKDKNTVSKNNKAKQCLEDLRIEIALLREPLYYKDYLLLQNLFENQEKQFDKIKRIKWLLANSNTPESDFIDAKTAKRFVPFQDYDPRLLIRNFSFKSTIFRHSIRLAVTVMIGFSLGLLFSFQNPHWILLTVIIIMRPSYGLTKNRAKDRFIGTLIGGIVASIMVLLIQNPYIYGVMGVVSLVIALSLLQKNQKTSSVFITLSVVFIYAIVQSEVLAVIKFRIIDTLIGASLSYAAMRWFWPTWGFVGIKNSIEKSIKANMEFLLKITESYQRKGNMPTSYNIARKQAFLETSNLSSAFQRMAQEPKRKQREKDKVYELVVMNHSFLASLSSLSTYIRNHKTSEASDEFKSLTEKIKNNLEWTLQCLEVGNCDSTQVFFKVDHIFDEQLPNLSSLRKNMKSNDEENVRNIQETHLLWEQLLWLFSLSGKMYKLAASIKLD